MCRVLLEMTRECVMTFGAVLQDKWAIPSHLPIALYVLLAENITRKLSSLSLDLFFEFCFSWFSFLCSFLSLSFLLTFFRLVCCCSMWLYFDQGISLVFRVIVNWCRVAVNCKLSMVYHICQGRWWFQWIGCDYTAYMDYMDSDVLCLLKTYKLDYSLPEVMC